MGADRATSSSVEGALGTAVQGTPAGGRGIIYRYRTGVAWRDLPGEFGPWKTVWKRHRKFSADGTWDKIHAHLVAEADAAGDVDWTTSVDSTVNRAHQHATNMSRVDAPTGGGVELHGPALLAD